MPRALHRTEYCRQQAADCASAAAATKVDNVREAYRNLEQAWLELAPELENGGGTWSPGTPADMAAKRYVKKKGAGH